MGRGRSEVLMLREMSLLLVVVYPLALAVLGFYLPAERTRLLNSLYRTSQ